MIRHCVLVRARPDHDPDELAAVFAGLAGLRQRLPGMLAFAGGADVSPEGLQRGYTHAFTIDFTDASARDAYLVDPEHKALGTRLVATAEEARDGILALDFEA
jgi:hypothetical protein